MDRVIKLTEELIDVLVSVTDAASARDASGDVARITGEFQELEQRIEDNYSAVDIASADLWGLFSNLGQELNNEMARISANPEIFALLSEAFGTPGAVDAPVLTPVAPRQDQSGGAALPTIQPSADLSAGGSACLLFGELFAKYVTGLDPSTLLDVADTVQSIRSSGEAAEEEDIRNAVKGMVEAVDNSLGVPDDTFGIHLEAMSQACLTYYSAEFLSGFQP